MVNSSITENELLIGKNKVFRIDAEMCVCASFKNRLRQYWLGKDLIVIRNLMLIDTKLVHYILIIN